MISACLLLNERNENATLSYPRVSIKVPQSVQGWFIQEQLEDCAFPSEKAEALSVNLIRKPVTLALSPPLAGFLSFPVYSS